MARFSIKNEIIWWLFQNFNLCFSNFSQISRNPFVRRIHFHANKWAIKMASKGLMNDGFQGWMNDLPSFHVNILCGLKWKYFPNFCGKQSQTQEGKNHFLQYYSRGRNCKIGNIYFLFFYWEHEITVEIKWDENCWSQKFWTWTIWYFILIKLWHYSYLIKKI